MKKLTAYNPENDRQIEQMVSKAMCAYANAMEINNLNRTQHEIYMSEYEATVRCIDMFVKESIYEIQFAVIESAKEEFGI